MIFLAYTVSSLRGNYKLIAYHHNSLSATQSPVAQRACHAINFSGWPWCNVYSIVINFYASACKKRHCCQMAEPVKLDFGQVLTQSWLTSPRSPYLYPDLENRKANWKDIKSRPTYTELVVLSHTNHSNCCTGPTFSSSHKRALSKQ